jgi:hypothetical protein
MFYLLPRLNNNNDETPTRSFFLPDSVNLKNTTVNNKYNVVD